MTTKELRQIAAAAFDALRAAEDDSTMTNAEIDRFRRAARKAHKHWLDAVIDKLIGTGPDEIADCAA